jgi:NADPH:quinone reductase-like Zn-dependent oxidoreductase
MKAAVLSDYSEPPRAGEFEDPSSSNGAVLVDVSVAGLNPVDLYTAAGELPDKPPLPSVAGREGIGRADGRRVYFDRSVPPYGSMAERTLVDPETLVEVPEGVSDEEAVAFGIAGLAAWLGLEWRAEMQPGETVLVLGASGIVGQIAVQAAKHFEAARVIAAARKCEALEYAKEELGADEIVDLSDEENLVERFREAANGADIDIVFDPIWGPAAIAALEATGRRGRLVQVGNSAGKTAEVPARMLRTNVRAILGHTNFEVPQAIKAHAFTRMCELAATGRMRVPVERVALDEVDEAWRRQQEGHPHRKLVIAAG